MSTRTSTTTKKAVTHAKDADKASVTDRGPTTKKAAPAKKTARPEDENLGGGPLIHLNDLVVMLAKSGITREALTAAAAELPAGDSEDDDLEGEGFEFTIPVGEARTNFKALVDRARTHPTLLTKHGKPVAAVVSAHFYERAIEALEDLEDQAAVDRYEERQAAGEVKTYSSAEVDKMLGFDA